MSPAASALRVLLIDNYDSFTFNLYQYLCELGAEVTVRRNDAMTLDEVEAFAPDCIVISPGPGTPSDAGISVDVIRTFGPRLPTLGVCLGHQAIGQAFGGKVVRAPELMHGKTSRVSHVREGVLADLPDPFTAVRYHSLCVEESSLPPTLEVTARSVGSGVIMGLRHRDYEIHGVQFHPESILSESGKQLLANFLHIAEAAREKGTHSSTRLPSGGSAR